MYIRKYSPYNELIYYIRKGDIQISKWYKKSYLLHSLDAIIWYIQYNKKVINDKSVDTVKKHAAVVLQLTVNGDVLNPTDNGTIRLFDGDW